MTRRHRTVNTAPGQENSASRPILPVCSGRCHRTVLVQCHQPAPHKATELQGAIPPHRPGQKNPAFRPIPLACLSNDATVLSFKQQHRTRNITSVLASVKTPPHVTLSIPMNHRCHGVMAGPLTSDRCHEESLLPPNATALPPNDNMSRRLQ